MTLLMVLIGVIVGQLAFYGPKYLHKHGCRFPVVFRSTPTHLLIGLRGPVERRLEPPAPAVPEELDADWPHVRELELGLYGFYWHTKQGECLPAGVTPAEEAEAAKLVEQQRVDEANRVSELRAAEIRKRTEARESAEQQRKAKIIADGIVDEDDLSTVTPEKIRSMTVGEFHELYQSHVAALHERTHLPSSGWSYTPPLYNDTVVDGVRLVDTEIRAIENTLTGPPWGHEIQEILAKEGLDIPVDGLLNWDYQCANGGGLLRFSARYDNGRTFSMTRIGDCWHVDRYL